MDLTQDASMSENNTDETVTYQSSPVEDSTAKAVHRHISMLRCPKCAQAIHIEAKNLVCASCSSAYPITDGVLDLRCMRKDYYFNPVPREAMNRLNRESWSQAWPKTIQTFMGHVRHNPDWIDNLTADGRYSWRMALDIKPGDKLLDLGCGLGNLSQNLAPQFGTTFSLDLTWERLHFARRRFALFNQGDEIVVIAGGDGKFLPFADASLDCVAVSGVLEWVADDESIWDGASSKVQKAAKMLLGHYGRTHPQNIQLAFLREIRRVLKPEGQLFVAIENRTNYEYFLGRPDHHSGLLFGSLLPRSVANAYAIAKAKRPYRTFTYSIGGYRKLLRKAGFSASEFYGLTPGYTRLSEIIPLTPKSAVWQPTPATGFMNRVKRNARLVPAYGMVASRSGDTHVSIMERLVAEISVALKASPDQCAVKTWHVTGKEKMVIEAQLDRIRAAIRIPCNVAAKAAEQRNHNILSTIASQQIRCEFIPKALTKGTLQGVAYFVESWQLGESLVGLAPAQQCAVATSALEQLHAKVVKPTTIDLAEFEKRVLDGFSAIESAVEDPQLCARAKSSLQRMLLGAKTAFGIQHGDFGLNNLLHTGDQLSGLIDWEDARLDGVPVLDAINFVHSSVRRLFSNDSMASSLARVISLENLPPEMSQFLWNAYDRFQTSREHHRGLVYLYWLHHVCAQLQGGLTYDRPQIEMRIAQVLRVLADDVST